ncbi:serine/threonine-protein kinase Nek4 [Diretmus argenteus]
MGFCEGGDLYHRLKQQKGELLPERQVVEWFVQIAMALQYLHEKHILHRDLKTQNIFLTKTNIIKVGDLGIARVLENQNDMASTLIGTPYYMSPELFSNKPYNHKSDVWALGCCVYEMSTLKHAFNAKDMNSLVYRIVEGKLPQMPSKYDPQLGEMIKSMLCRRPEDRPDVKLILRQPYIKRQIAMFLEATKEKTGKSRKKDVGGSGDNKANSAACIVSPQPKPETPLSSQSEPPARGRKKENSQQHKHRNGVTDRHPAQTPPVLKPSPSDALEGGTVSLATISNISIDIQPQEHGDLMERQVQRPQSVVANSQTGNEPVTHSVPKDRRGRGKPDPSPPPAPLHHPLKPISGVVSGEEEERRPSDGLLGVYPQAPLNPGNRCSAFVEKQMLDVDYRDDTTELLKEVEMENQNLEVNKQAAVSKSVPEQPSVQHIRETLEVNVDNKNDTVTLLKAAPSQSYTSDNQESFESTEKLLEPFPPATAPEPSQEEFPSQVASLSTPGPTPPYCSLEPSVSQQHRQRDMGQTRDQEKFKVAAPRPLPPPPVGAIEGRKRSRGSTEKKKATVAASSTSVSSSKDRILPLPQDRPLSARERRRLRQSQEIVSQPGVSAVRRASYDYVTSSKDEHHVLVSRSVSDSITEANNKQGRRSDEDECSSSTSSTERSEGDYRERKSDSKDMQDLVQMMTQTLRMDGRDGVNELDRSRYGSTALPEFKLNRMFRDTLMLHGKAQEEDEDFPFNELPMSSTSGPAKIRRAIEHLRTDVVKGLGVKLLDRVLEIMEEEDDNKRELYLRHHMGEEKYQAYAVMVRQLKFFEDVAVEI